MTTLSQLLNELHQAEQDALVPDDLKKKGWRYQDWPCTFSPEAWDYLLAILGDGEYRVLVYSSGIKNGQQFKRGQLLISPQGYTHLQDKERRMRIALDMKMGFATPHPTKQ